MPTDKKLQYLKKISNPAIYFFFMLWRLPSLVFWGVKLKHLSDNQCVVLIKQRWTNQNPFDSIYFSALNGAAELSTGLLFQLHLQEIQKYSMLVVSSKSQFKKKARGRITFVCNDGEEIQKNIDNLSNSGETFTFTAISLAKDETESEVGEFEFTWSVKRIL